MKKNIIIAMLAFIANTTFAQIGYQVSLLNSATGQPRAGETVTVDIKLTNCENTTVYTTQQKATSNDFGVLSLSVGDAKTFDELDWNKLPLYIEVSIDGVLIAKSQVLSVPVAEYAKKSGFVLTKELLVSKKWIYTSSFNGRTESLSFFNDGSFYYDSGDPKTDECDCLGKYYIYGDNVILQMRNPDSSHIYYAEIYYFLEGNGLIFSACLFN